MSFSSNLTLKKKQGYKKKSQHQPHPNIYMGNSGTMRDEMSPSKIDFAET